MPGGYIQVNKRLNGMNIGEIISRQLLLPSKIVKITGICIALISSIQ